MWSDRPDGERRRPAYAAIYVFPMLGPLIVIGGVFLAFAVFSIVALQPGLVLYYLLLIAYWVPSVYAVLALPFLLTGVFFWLASYRNGGRSLPSALACAVVAFGLTIAGFAVLSNAGLTSQVVTLEDAGNVALATLGIVPAVIVLWRIFR